MRRLKIDIKSNRIGERHERRPSFAHRAATPSIHSRIFTHKAPCAPQDLGQRKVCKLRRSQRLWWLCGCVVERQLEDLESLQAVICALRRRQSRMHGASVVPPPIAIPLS
jgi:hypothetical protein